MKRTLLHALAGPAPRRALRLACLPAVCLLWASTAQAQEEPKRFSLAISTGLRPDMASLGATITQDGTVDTGETTMANLVYSTDKALMSDRNNLAIWHNSKNTNSPFRLLGEEPVLGGPMLGIEIGAKATYELDDVIDFPLYVQLGFHYATRMSGGHQERVLGDAAAANPQLAALLQANGEDPADYVGGRMITDYDASWFEIPINLGIKVPITTRDYTFAYGQLGVSFFQGGFSVGIDADEAYTNVLATHVDTEALTVNNLSPGAVQDTIDFRIGSMGVNYGVGVQTGVSSGLAIFLELNSSGTAKTVYSSELAPETRQLLTATSSETLAESDDQWFKRLAFPVVAGGATVRTGLRYYFF